MTQIYSTYIHTTQQMLIVSISGYLLVLQEFVNHNSCIVLKVIHVYYLFTAMFGHLRNSLVPDVIVFFLIAGHSLVPLTCLCCRLSCL